MEFRPTDGKASGAIRLVYYLGGKKTLGLGVVVPETEWDRRKAFVRPSSLSWTKLCSIRTSLEDLVGKSMREGVTLTSAMVRACALGEEVKEEVKEVEDVWEWLFSLARMQGKRKTARVYVAALKSFQKHNEEAPTERTLLEWNLWVNANLKTGTSRTYLKSVRAMLVKAYKAKLIDFKAEVDKVKEEEKAGKLPLTPREVKALEGLKLRGEEDLVRDLFLLGVCTSLRRTDWDLRTSDIGTTITTRKTGDLALIADTPRLHKLLMKHKGRLHLGMLRPSCKTEEGRDLAFDGVLRQVMYKLSGKCKSLSTIVEHQGEKVPRWMATGSHSARKGFISTNAEHLPVAVIAQATGHKDLRQLQRYIHSLRPDKATAKLFR